jgi:hypothetical protein
VQPTQLSLLPDFDPAPAATAPAVVEPVRSVPAMPPIAGQLVLPEPLPEPLAGAVVTVLARMIAQAAEPGARPAATPVCRDGGDRR